MKDIFFIFLLAFVSFMGGMAYQETRNKKDFEHYGYVISDLTRQIEYLDSEDIDNHDAIRCLLNQATKEQASKCGYAFFTE